MECAGRVGDRRRRRFGVPRSGWGVPLPPTAPRELKAVSPPVPGSATALHMVMGSAVAEGEVHEAVDTALAECEGPGLHRLSLALTPPVQFDSVSPET